MAGFFQQYLGGVKEGFFGTPNLRDFEHASKTFTKNGYANAPKFKNLFHVYFEINDTLVAERASAFPDKEIPGLLVKNITLPKYNIQLAELNQYNRKRYVQTKINYDPVTITFHDDNLNSVMRVWNNFYNYYYNDPLTASAAKASVNTRNTYNKDYSAEANWGYLGEPSTSSTASAMNNPKPAYFKTIKIYGFNQHSFSVYTLVNPIIERFEHDTYDYTQGNGSMENRMTVKFETVTYAEGALNGTKPEVAVPGFGLEQNYDRRLSPISRPGSNATIMGQGGLVDAADGILTDISNGNWLGAIQKAGTAAKTFKNVDNLVKIAKTELKSNVLKTISNPSNFRGLFNFPSF